MKNKYAIIVIAMIYGAFMLAAVESQAQASVGIRGGLNASNISFESLPNKGERFGFHAGIFTDLPVVANFMSIQPELSYSTKGTAFEPLNERQTLDMNYLDLLLPVAFKLGSIDLQVGPFASYLLSTPDYTAFNDRTIISDAFNKFDAGLTAGLSYYFNKLMVGIRYNQGFIDVTQDNAQLLLGNGKNAVGQVSLGYKF
jgi:hypothetical protein